MTKSELNACREFKAPTNHSWGVSSASSLFHTNQTKWNPLCTYFLWYCQGAEPKYHGGEDSLALESAQCTKNAFHFLVTYLYANIISQLLFLNTVVFFIMTLYSLVGGCTTNMEAHAAGPFSIDGMHLPDYMVL
jgi:hypothetical protein